MAAHFARWRVWLVFIGVLCACGFGSLILHPTHLHAAAITVMTCADNVPGSLRDALDHAGDGDVIRFGLDCPSATPILLIADTLTIRMNLTIDGNGHVVTISGGNAVGLFAVTGGVRLTLNALTLADGTRMFGGGIDNNGGAVIVTNSTFRGTKASFEGGAIFNNSGTVAATNCTFVGDAAEYAGGAIFNNDGTLTVTSSTFVGNAASQGGSIDNRSRATLTNTLVASSTGGALSNYGGFRGDHNLIEDAASSGGFTDGGSGNLIGHPALLGPPDAYGNPMGVLTIPLLPGSPAIDGGISETGVPSGDQRGLPRIGTPDIGAFESQGFLLAISGGTDQSAPVGATFANPLAVRVSSSHSEPVQGGRVTFTAPTSGASALLTGTPAIIASSGTAQATATANRSLGVYTVIARAAGAGTVSFALRNIAPRIILGPGALANGVGNQFYSQPLTATGGAAPYRFTVTAGSLPDGCFLSTSGILSGTPRVAKIFTFTVQATDADGVSGSRSYTLAITAPTVSISPTFLPGGTTGVTYSFTSLSATGGTGPYTFSLGVGSLPSGMTLSSTGTLGGTPGTSGLFFFTVQVRDAAGFVGSQSYTLAIAAAPA